MSIEIMTRVWKKSKQGGSQLLLLLAIADNANDGGFAWPGQVYLAKKIRMNKRSVARLSGKLQEAGELYVISRGDEGKVTRYIVTVDMSWEQLEDVLKKVKFDKIEIAQARLWFDRTRKRGVTDCQGCQSDGGDIAVSRGVDIAVSTEPSLTVNEPSFLENSQNPSPEHTPTERQALNKLGKAIARSGLGNHTTTDELRAITLIGFDIAEITKTDILTIDTGELNALAGLTIRLSAKGNIAAKLKAFDTWWYNVHWLGKDKGQRPTVKQIGSNWGQFEADKVAPPNGAATGPALSDAEKERLAELTAQFSPTK